MTPPKRLVVVDDEPDFAQLVVKVAGDLGYEAVALSSGAAFRAAYRASGPPDVIVLDIVMPEQDGIEIMKWLVGEGCCARILIISGHSPAYASAARVFGEAKGKMRIAQLAKPVSLADLRAAIEAEQP